MQKRSFLTTEQKLLNYQLPIKQLDVYFIQCQKSTTFLKKFVIIILNLLAELNRKRKNQSRSKKIP